MREITEGWIVIADISGYTRFMTGADLATGHDVVADLLRTVLASMRSGESPLRVVKIEGDAVLCRAEGAATTGAAVLDRIDDGYHAFKLHLLTLERLGRCACFACGAAKALDLKFVVHYGPYVVHDLAGHEDLSGASVVVAHRLLKNTVVERSGVEAYAFFSDEARRRCPEGTPFRDHEETYDHIGLVRGGVLDLGRSFDAASHGARLAVSDDDADARAEWTVPLAPVDAWAWHVESSLRDRWDPGAGWALDGSGRRGAGATGRSCSLDLRVIEWRHPRSVTFDVGAGVVGGERRPALRTTLAFEDTGAGTTRVVERIRALDRDDAALAFLPRWRAVVPELRTEAARALASILDERTSAAS